MSTSVRTSESALLSRAERVPSPERSLGVILDKDQGSSSDCRRAFTLGRARVFGSQLEAVLRGRPADLRRRERGARKEIPLAVASAGVADRAVLTASLDPFGDDRGAELGAQLDHAG